MQTCNFIVQVQELSTTLVSSIFWLIGPRVVEGTIMVDYALLKNVISLHKMAIGYIFLALNVVCKSLVCTAMDNY